MAIYNGRILMRKGLEADFDASKLMSGEWALSTDKGIIRICLEAGKVIRMATYEAFEEDMKQIEAILLECQTIEEAVQIINTEINANVNAVVEYVEQAKTYRDEALQFRNEAEAFKNQAGEIAGIDIATTEKAGIVKPDGETLEVNADGTMRVIGGGGVSDYSELENKPSINGTELNGNKTLNDLGIASATELEKTNTKVNTIIEKADLGIKETASGEEIHLTDSAEGKAVEFALYGKATQDGEPTPENPQKIEVSGESYNLLENTATSQTINGVEFVVNEDKSISVNGTSTEEIIFMINNSQELENGDYILSGVINGTDSTYKLQYNVNDYFHNVFNAEIPISKSTEHNIIARIVIRKGVTVDTNFKPMIRKASVKNDRYMPYGNGSVEVKSVGKNLLDYPDTNAKSGNHWLIGDVTTSTSVKSKKISLSKGTYTFSIKSDVAMTNAVSLNLYNYLGDRIKQVVLNLDVGYNSVTFAIEEEVYSISSYTNVTATFSEIQLEKGSQRTEYQEFKETLAKIQTENGLAGIKVSSNGNYTDQSGQQWICDEVVKYADGSGAYIQRIGKTIFTDAVWHKNTENNFYTTKDSKKYAINSYGLCSNLISDKSATFNNLFINGGGDIRVNTTASDVSTISEIMKDSVFYGILAEPITTPLTAEEIAEISTFYPVTNISNDFDCGMSVTYYADSKNYIDKQLAEMEKAREQAMMSMFLLLPEETQATMIENDVNNLLTESEI